MKTLADWLSYLEQLHPSAIDMGLERAGEVARRLGLGRPASTVITVTGTNGKAPPVRCWLRCCTRRGTA